MLRSGRASSGLPGVPVLGGHPLLHLAGLSVLQPPVGVGDLDTVQRVDHLIRVGSAVAA